MAEGTSEDALIAVGRAEPAIMCVQSSGIRKFNFQTLNERNNMLSNGNSNNGLGLVVRGTIR